MTSWQVPGMPGMSELLRLLQVQADVLASLPDTVTELSRAVRSLAETVEHSRATVASAQRVTERVELLLGELEDPVRDLRPGVERLARVLNDPAIERIPTTIQSVESTVLPVATSAARARSRLAHLRRLPGRVRQAVRPSGPPEAGSGEPADIERQDSAPEEPVS